YVEQTSGRTLCAVDGSTDIDKIPDFSPNSNLLIPKSWGDCLMSLQLGQANAVVVDDALLSGMMAQDPYSAIVGETLDTEVYGICLRKPEPHYDSRALIRQVNST